MKKGTLATILGALAVFFSAALWGVDGIVLRPSLYDLSVYIVVFLGHLIAFAFMAPFFIREWKETKKLNLVDWISMGLVALLGGAIGTVAITKSLFIVGFQGYTELSSLSGVLILQKLQPVFAILLAILFLGEKPKKSFYPWAIVALLGSYLITFGFYTPQFSSNSFFIASMLSLLAAFSFGSSTVLGKRVLNRINFRVTTYLRFGLTSLIMLFIIAITNKFAAFSSVSLHPHITTLILIAFTTGGAAIFLYYWGLKRIMASRATLYELGFPLTAIALDYMVNGQLMSPGQFLGAGLIILSIIIITRQEAEKT